MLLPGKVENDRDVDRERADPQERLLVDDLVDLEGNPDAPGDDG